MTYQTKADHDKASEDDRRWFEAHPGATYRVRRPTGDEAHDPAMANPVVLVRQLAPGMRLRELYDLRDMLLEEVRTVEFREDGWPVFRGRRYDA